MIKKTVGVGLIVASVYIASALSSNDEVPDDSKLSVTVSKKQKNSTHVNLGDQASPALTGRTAYLDPKTGRLTSLPSASIGNTEAVQAELNLPPVKYTTYADGTVGAALNGRFRTPLMATINCDGKVTTEHSNEFASNTVNCEATNEK